MALGIITLNTEYFPDPAKGIPVSLGSIFIGAPDTDPEILANRVNIVVRQEDGTDVPIAPAGQPINTSPGGVALYNGNTVRLLVEGNYSIKVLRADSTQAYYISSATPGTPVQKNEVVVQYDNIDAIRTQASPDELIYIKGHTTDGDKGGGTFYWNASSLATDDNGSVVKLDGTTTGRYLREKGRTYSIAQFGGFPGGQDSLVPFNNAVAAALGESILIHPGTYSVTSGDFSNDTFHSFGAVTFSDNTTFDVFQIGEIVPPLTVAGYTSSPLFYLYDNNSGHGTMPSGNTSGVWQSVGKTGSGTDLIWTDLDLLPLDANYIYVGVTFFGGAINIGAPIYLVSSIITRRFGATAGGVNLLNASFKFGDANAATAKDIEASFDFRSIIPLDSANKFERSYLKGSTSNIAVQMLGFGV